MFAVIKIIIDSYEKFEKDHADPRTENFLFISSMLYPFTIIGVYYYFVRHLGPKLMKDRTPFNLKKTILTYNLIQIILNGAFFIYISYHWISNDYQFACEPIDKYYEKHTGEIRVSWLYFILKVSDLLDTVFFILRKKEKQATFLHVYHHAVMVLCIWVGVKYSPDGHNILIPFINSAVHTVMYSYYLVSNWNPSYIKISMKKTVTLMQMLQFAILMLQNVLGLLTKDCDYPKLWMLLLLPQQTFMFFMFLDFYRRTYGKKKPQ